MQPQLMKSIRGYVIVQVRGKGIETFLNRATAGGISLWDIRRTGQYTAQANLPVGDFFRLRPLLKQTGCRVHVLKRYGLPFFLSRLEKRKFFIAGLVGFLIGLYLLSSVVWQVEVEGNDKIPAHDILQAAESQGVYRLQWKFRLRNLDEISHAILTRLPGTSWVGLEVQGTRIVIKVVESTRPDAASLNNPRNLVASKNAVVTEITATKGRPLVAPHSYVRKGDVLISGFIGDDANKQVVVAQGKVKGIVWYESAVEAPLSLQYKVYTGDNFKRFYLVFGTRALQVTGYGKKALEPSETIEDRKVLQWRNITLPFGWLTEKVMQAQMVEQPIDAEAAKSVGLERAQAELLSAAGEEARIVSHNILQEKIENGKVYMKVLFQVEETIMEEQPIVQGE